MELTILDHDFRDLYVIDDYESLIWTERYYQPGDFQLVTPINETILDVVHLITNNLNQKLDVYIWTKDSDTMMCIESVQIKTDIEIGTKVTMKGSSLTSILNRRIIWEQTILDGYLENQIEKLINQNIIQPSISDRKIEEIVYLSSGDERIKKMKIQAQFTGDNLLEALEKICKLNNIGFNMNLTNDNKLAFQLYMGEDRSYEQTINPAVIFSIEYDNLLNTNYLESITDLKNVALVAGEDVSLNRKTRVIGSGSGLKRRELYVDARDIQSIDQNGNKIPDSEYNAQLDQRGEEYLTEYKYIKAFEGEIETHQSFVYGKDFFKGDIVQIENEFGMEGRVRILELIQSFESSGFKMYPTFEVVEDEK